MFEGVWGYRGCFGGGKVVVEFGGEGCCFGCFEGVEEWLCWHFGVNSWTVVGVDNNVIEWYSIGR